MNGISSKKLHTPLGPFYMLFEGARTEARLIFAGFSDPNSSGTRISVALRKHLASHRMPPQDNTSRSQRPNTEQIYPEHKNSEKKLSEIAVIETVTRQLQHYFRGESSTFNIPLKLYGSPFQLAVWNYLLQIKSGTTITYGEVARGSGYPRAVRAVGSAVGTNPISIIVPCHRVVPASGGIGNYGGGSERKKYLLERENAQI